MAHALGMATDVSPPIISQLAKHSIGLTRLPPASKEYRIDSCTVSGYAIGTAASRAALTFMAVAMTYLSKLKSSASTHAHGKFKLKLVWPAHAQGKLSTYQFEKLAVLLLRLLEVLPANRLHVRARSAYHRIVQGPMSVNNMSRNSIS